MKTKTYILKYTCHNSIAFPVGTIVKVNDPNWEFEVVEGDLKGKKGNIADGLNGWLIENNVENRRAVKIYLNDEKKLEQSIKSLRATWGRMKTVKL